MSDWHDLPYEEHEEAQLWVSWAAARGGMELGQIALVVGGGSRQNIEQLIDRALDKVRLLGLDWERPAALRPDAGAQEFPTKAQ